MRQLDELHRAVSWRGKVGRLLRRITPINEPVVLKQDLITDPSTENLEID